MDNLSSMPMQLETKVCYYGWMVLSLYGGGGERGRATVKADGFGWN